MITIKVKVHEGGTMPSFNPKGDWVDLHAAEDVELQAPVLNLHNNQIQFQHGLIDLKLSFAIPEGYEMHILPRSSTFKNWGIIMTNSMGIVDYSYRGNDDIVKFPFMATREAKINKGDRICQMRVVKSMLAESQGALFLDQVDSLSDENRGGFGSTGK